MRIEYKVGDLTDLDSLILVGDQLFDLPVKEANAREFLEDARHHIILAYDGDHVVGMVSAVHYIHPDKDPNLFINEASVVDSHQNQGIGRELVKRMVSYGKDQLSCIEAWVLTSESNSQAQKAYVAAGGVKDPDTVVMFDYS